MMTWPRNERSRSGFHGGDAATMPHPRRTARKTSMAHVAFVCPPLRGHWEPTLALARTLAERRHRVSLITDAADLPHVETIAVFDPGLPAAGGLLETVRRHAGILGTVRAMARRCDALCERLPPLLQGLGADLVVADQTEPAGALAAMRLGLPHASLACALPLDREPGIPPPFVDWMHHPDGSRDWLYVGGHRVTDWLMQPLSRVIYRRAQSWGMLGVATSTQPSPADCRSSSCRGRSTGRASLRPRTRTGSGPCATPGLNRSACLRMVVGRMAGPSPFAHWARCRALGPDCCTISRRVWLRQASGRSSPMAACFRPTQRRGCRATRSSQPGCRSEHSWPVPR